MVRELQRESVESGQGYQKLEFVVYGPKARASLDAPCLLMMQSTLDDHGHREHQ